MKQKHFSLSMFWDARTKDVNGVARIMLTVNLKSSGQFRVSLKLWSTKSDFKKAMSVERIKSEEVKELRMEMNNYLQKAEDLFERVPTIDRPTFNRLFKSETDLFQNDRIDMFPLFQLKLAELKEEEREGTYKYYLDCFDSVKRFQSKVYLEDIDEKWLKKYQLFMKGRGNAPASISSRIRGLQHIYNRAVKAGFIKTSKNHFENISTSSHIKSKSVLYAEHLKALWDYEPIGLRERRAKATFFFLYLANGMNHKDMAYLNRSSIKKNSFTFIREKTKNTTSSPAEITVYLNDELNQIISEWGNKDVKSPYVFPILKGTTVEQMEKARTTHKRVCNKKLRLIGKKLGFEVSLNTNLARHSFATMHKIMGTPTAFISDAMGHSSPSVTAHYLKTLPEQNLKNMASVLLSFNQTPS